MLYLDTSALLKIIWPEPESSDLRAWLDQQPDELLATSALAEVELPRALRRLSGGERLVRQAAALLDDNLLVIEIDGEVRRAAARLSDPLLRSLDAVHLASAYQLRPELTALVTYDVRMARATDPTVPVASPGASEPTR